MTTRRKHSGLALALMLASGSVRAEVIIADDAPDPLLSLYGSEETISLVTGVQKPLRLAPSVASVITADEIRKSGARSLDQVLEQVPGLHVTPSGLSRQDAVYSIRGIHTGFNPQVLVLMDGAPFPHLFSGGRPVTFRLPVENIARVEVIRGPASALYGADAFAGVINVITKTPKELAGTRAGGRGGSFGSSDLWLQHGRDVGTWETAASLEWNQANGDTRRVIEEDAQTLLDPALSHAPGPLETGYDVLNGHLVASKGGFTARGWGWVQNDGGMGPGGAQALDPEGRQDLQLWMGDLSYTQPDLLPSLEGSVRLNYFYSKDDSYFQLFPRGQYLPEGLIGNPLSYDQQARFEVTGLYTGWEKHRLRLGAGVTYSEEETEEWKNFGPGVVPGVLTDVSDTPFVYMEAQNRLVQHLSLQDEWSFAPDWNLTAGLRFDRYSDFGDTVNPRLALVWEARHDLTAKLMYGRAFRAPAFSELYAINNPVVLGNPGLSPEIIQTVEMAFDYRPTANLRTAFNVFHYDVEGLIAFVPDAGQATNTAQNALDQEGNGFELEAEWRATPSLSLSGHFSFQKAVDTETSARVANAPGKEMMVAAHWQFQPDWSLHPSVNWVMDRRRADGDDRVAVADYAVADLALRRENLWNHWEAALLATNLFDTDIREPGPAAIPKDYPMEGFGLFFEMRYTLP